MAGQIKSKQKVKKSVLNANQSNRAGGPAYQLEAKQALAQIAATGCLNNTFHCTTQDQQRELQTLINSIDDNVYLAKLAIYAREKAAMKDMPAALVLMLARRDAALMHAVFDRVVDNGRLVRTLFQMIRSGAYGRQGLGSSLKRAFARWLNHASVTQLLSASIGNDPSLRDVLRLARPKPTNNARRALFGYLTQKEVCRWAPAKESDLPLQVRMLKEYRNSTDPAEQAILLDELSARWDLLADAAAGVETWKALGRRMGPQALRMNLNTLLRQKVFEKADGSPDEWMIGFVADRLSDRGEIQRSRQFPYQYFSAYKNASSAMPDRIVSALCQSAELACGNIPTLAGPLIIGVDTSGSMMCPVTGHRGPGATSSMRCVDVAALFASALYRRNPGSVIIPFDTRAHSFSVAADETILSLADRLSQLGGGGTDCSIPLLEANTTWSHRAFAGVVLVSDMESWVYGQRPVSYGSKNATGVLTRWQDFVGLQTRLGKYVPRLVCLDLQPSSTSQAPERSDILNIGGFNDAVFSVMDGFLRADADRLVRQVESIAL